MREREDIVHCSCEPASVDQRAVVFFKILLLYLRLALMPCRESVGRAGTQAPGQCRSPITLPALLLPREHAHSNDMESRTWGEGLYLPRMRTTAKINTWRS